MLAVDGVLAHPDLAVPEPVEHLHALLFLSGFCLLHVLPVLPQELPERQVQVLLQGAGRALVRVFLWQAQGEHQTSGKAPGVVAGRAAHHARHIEVLAAVHVAVPRRAFHNAGQNAGVLGTEGQLPSFCFDLLVHGIRQDHDEGDVSPRRFFLLLGSKAQGAVGQLRDAVSGLAQENMV